MHAFQAPAPAAAVALASVRVPARQKLRNLRVRGRLTQSGTLSARGIVTLGKRYRLKRAKVVAAPGQTVTLRLSLTAKGLRAAKRALRRHRRVQAVITVVVIGPAGQVEKSTHTVTLR